MEVNTILVIQLICYFVLCSFQFSAVVVTLLVWGNASALPVGIIVLQAAIVNGKRQDSGVVVKTKVVMGSLRPLDLLRSKLW